MTEFAMLGEGGVGAAGSSLGWIAAGAERLTSMLRGGRLALSSSVLNGVGLAGFLATVTGDAGGAIRIAAVRAVA